MELFSMSLRNVKFSLYKCFDCKSDENPSPNTELIKRPPPDQIEGCKLGNFFMSKSTASRSPTDQGLAGLWKSPSVLITLEQVAVYI